MSQNVKSERITITGVTAREKQYAKALAKLHGLTLSEYVRMRMVSGDSVFDICLDRLGIEGLSQTIGRGGRQRPVSAPRNGIGL